MAGVEASTLRTSVRGTWGSLLEDAEALAAAHLPPDKKRRKKEGLLHRVCRLGSEPDYYLIVEQDLAKEKCTVMPLCPAGEFNPHSARRGRTRYRLVSYGIEDAVEGRREIALPDMVITPADMVGKTAEVSRETWDIFDQ